MSRSVSACLAVSLRVSECLHVLQCLCMSRSVCAPLLLFYLFIRHEGFIMFWPTEAPFMPSESIYNRPGRNYSHIHLGASFME